MAITGVSAAAPAAMETVRAFERLAAQSLWPGFDATKTPLAIYDGERTWLVGHPDPPTEFAREDGLDASVRVYSGLHASIRANTTVDVNGVATATLTLASVTGGAEGAASVAIHEAFHAHQNGHGAWPTANEAALFTYPIENAAALGRSGHVSGLGARPADDVRGRAYATGHAIAALLERFDPGCKTAIEADPSVFLDEALTAAVDGVEATAVKTPAAARNTALRAAEGDVAALKAERAERLADFEALEGWSVEVMAPPERRLWPQGFDPLNVARVDDVHVLHTRFVKVGNDAGWIEALDATALTEGFGPHPLFNGVQRVVVRGLGAEPALTRDGEDVALAGNGVTARFARAEARTTGSRIVIQLLP